MVAIINFVKWLIEEKERGSYLYYRKNIKKTKYKVKRKR